MKARGELQIRNLEAAERLAHLSIDHTLKVVALLAVLARELFELNVRHMSELAGADTATRLRLRVEHARQTAEKMVDSARRIAELGNETRIGFSRLLTEQLASGHHGLMDAFQAFFAVLPAQDVNLLSSLQLAIERTDRAFGDIHAVIAEAASAPVPVTARPAARKALPAAGGVSQPDVSMA